MTLRGKGSYSEREKGEGKVKEGIRIWERKWVLIEGMTREKCKKYWRKRW